MPLFDMVQMTVSGVPGTGPITLGAALVADGVTYQTLAAAGAVNGDVVAYRARDGSAWELDRGTVGSGGLSLTRGLVKSSTGSLLSLTSAATIAVVALADDFRDALTTGITAGGTTQAAATQLVATTERQLFVLSTVATPGGAVALPAGRAGRECIVKNSGANPAQVFPVIGGSARINSEAVNAVGAIIQPGGMLRFLAESATQWHV